MEPLVLDFVPLWTLILGVGVCFYVILDGFDLGVGILFGFQPDTESRNMVMNSIARSGTATRPGWFWAAWRCWPHFRSPSPSSFRPSIFPYWSCCWR